MTDFSMYDVIVVKFPFASSLKYKARPAVVVSSEGYNDISRNTLIIVAISSQVSSKLEIEADNVSIDVLNDIPILKLFIPLSSLINY